MVLFLLGAALAYYTLAQGPRLPGQHRRRRTCRPSSARRPYFQLVTYMMLAFGVGFEFPIVLVFLQLAGVLDRPHAARRPPLRHRRHRRCSSRCITPSGDPYSLAILSIPMYLFYEASIIIGLLLTRKRRKGEATRQLMAGPHGPSHGGAARQLRVRSRPVPAGRGGRASTRAARCWSRHPPAPGKTVVADYAVADALDRGLRAFYTTPIKALSNQKFGDLRDRYGAGRVGLLTGDNSIDGDAPVVVMTTEVLRNMIYAGRPLDDLGVVVLDEVHYLQNSFRGPVWEEVIVHLPEHVQLVCLSATVSNADDIGDWLTTVRGPTDVVVEQTARSSWPTPTWSATRPATGCTCSTPWSTAVPTRRASASTSIVTAAPGRGRGGRPRGRPRRATPSAAGTRRTGSTCSTCSLRRGPAPRHRVRLQPGRMRRRGRRPASTPGCG